MSRPRNASALLMGNETFHYDPAGCLCSGAAIGNPEAGPRPCAVHRLPSGRLNELGEKDLNFPFGRFRRVRAVHDVLLNQQRMIPPDRARGSDQRICGAGQQPECLNCPVSLDDHGDQGTRGYELDQRFEKGFALVLAVVHHCGLTIERAHVQRNDPQSPGLEPGDHIPDETPAYAIGFYQNQGAVRQLCSSGSATAGVDVPGRNFDPARCKAYPRVATSSCPRRARPMRKTPAAASTAAAAAATSHQPAALVSACATAVVPAWTLMDDEASEPTRWTWIAAATR